MLDQQILMDIEVLRICAGADVDLDTGILRESMLCVSIENHPGRVRATDFASSTAGFIQGNFFGGVDIFDIFKSAVALPPREAAR